MRVVERTFEEAIVAARAADSIGRDRQIAGSRNHTGQAPTFYQCCCFLVQQRHRI
jgi:hypothetical protein